MRHCWVCNGDLSIDALRIPLFAVAGHPDAEPDRRHRRRLTLGLRSGGVLLALLVLLVHPVLMFGAGAVRATVSGLGANRACRCWAQSWWRFLVLAPLATAAALRLAED